MHVERIEPGTHSRARIQSWSIHPHIRTREAGTYVITVGDRLGVYRADVPGRLAERVDEYRLNPDGYRIVIDALEPGGEIEACGPGAQAGARRGEGRHQGARRCARGGIHTWPGERSRSDPDEWPRGT
jgi:hypothetical protein